MCFNGILGFCVTLQGYSIHGYRSFIQNVSKSASERMKMPNTPTGGINNENMPSVDTFCYFCKVHKGVCAFLLQPRLAIFNQSFVIQFEDSASKKVKLKTTLDGEFVIRGIASELF